MTDDVQQNYQSLKILLHKKYLSSGGLQWTDGSPYEYFNWNDGEPSDEDGSENENCVELYTFNGKWNDIICGASNGYVCKVLKCKDSFYILNFYKYL